MPSNILTSLVLASLLASAGPRDIDFTTYEAKSRSAEELQKAADGLATGARISVLNNKMVIAGTKSQREAVLKLFEELDHRLLNYFVQVRAAKRADSDRDASALEANSRVGNARVAKRSGVLRGEGQGAVAVGGVRAAAEGQNGDSQSDSVQSVQVTEGADGQLWAGGALRESMLVRVRAVGKAAAHVELRQANQKNGPSISTELDLRLGEWRTVGGLQQSQNAGRGEILGRERVRGNSTGDVQIKVDLAN